MPATKRKLVQIVVTRHGPDKFCVITFNGLECTDRKVMGQDDAGKLVLKSMKRLKAIPSGID